MRVKEMRTRWKVLVVILGGAALCLATLLLSAFSLDNYHYPNAQRVDGCGTSGFSEFLNTLRFDYSNCYEVAADPDDVNTWYRSAGWIHFGKGDGGGLRLDIGPFCYSFQKIYMINDVKDNLLSLRHYFIMYIGLCTR
ncbi:MAG: hypothetical protein DWQ07_08475 [Chloroflexi bacterium]|nr:MAG: hypothetical protein DWQ07_08475 [Chloroflexota bacterium]MBL1193253.1 hypothetical protein [Chloroflexota bacterium]